MRIKKILCSALLVSCMVFAMTACGSKKAAQTGSDAKSGNITVGFSQVGAESDWRTANSTSMKETFSEKNGYTLIFDDAQQKQENQIKAIRNFADHCICKIIG